LSLFITFEGVEGCGKTYQSKVLYKSLLASSAAVMLTYEPGGTDLGDHLRHLLKRKQEYKIPPESEVFLFAASRFNLVKEVIVPGLRSGKIVICDRFHDSTTAYQGYGRGVDLATIESIHRLALQGVKPSITILLDMPVEDGLRRKRTGNDRFERESVEFHKRVRNGYLELASKEPDRWFVIDGRLPRGEISKIVWERITALLPLMKD
jgi:dTMP kinase